MNWVWANLDLVAGRTLDHLVLTVPPIILTFVIAVPLGTVAQRYRITRGVILTAGGLLYAIPSLPLFIVLPAIVGTSTRSPLNLVIALTLYGIALMVRVVADALGSVDAGVRQSAIGVGFSPRRVFWQVDLPLAGPVLLAGMRVVAVSTVSLATVGAVIGVQGLGTLFTDGFQRGIQEEILAGIVATVLLAVAFDAALVGVGRLLMPWRRAEAAASTGATRAGERA